jgi:hypothetical protein
MVYRDIVSCIISKINHICNMASLITNRIFHIAWGFSDDIFNSIWLVWLFRFWGQFLLVVPRICPGFLCLVVFKVSVFVHRYALWGFWPFVVFCYILVNTLTLKKSLLVQNYLLLTRFGVLLVVAECLGGWMSRCDQLMRTWWSRGHTTHNQDWNMILESGNMSKRSVTQWKLVLGH